MEITELVSHLNDNGIVLYVEENKLKTQSHHEINGETAQLIRGYKEELINFFSKKLDLNLPDASNFKQFNPNNNLHELFEAQVKRTPKAVAISFGEQQLTYQQLNEKSNQLAHYLISHGVKTDVLVGLCIERSLEMIICMLGILKAGGAYVPFDPMYPPSRLSFMIEDSSVSILLSQRHLLEKVSSLNQATTPDDLQTMKVICLESEWESITTQPKEPPITHGDPGNLAYVMYTSGSTGQPKGILTPHQSAANYLNYLGDTYQLNSSDKILQLASFSFDASVRDILGPLTHGSQVVLPSSQAAKDPAALLSLIREHQITGLLSVVPSLLKELVEMDTDEGGYDSLRLLLVSGEALSLALCEIAQEVFGEQLLIVNQYGPTECTMTTTYYPVTTTTATDTFAPIGRPIPNMQVYILDEHANQVPIGVPGELHISGIGLAQGYLNQPTLTAQKFIQNPFSNDPQDRLYKTGDLVRWLPETQSPIPLTGDSHFPSGGLGNLEFIGRLDHQVKIRGFRVELGEIEARLLQQEFIKEAVVVLRDKETSPQLVAYLIPSKQVEQAQLIESLRNALMACLPEYMIPAAFVILEKFPLTPNGKINRQALPAPNYSEISYVPPATETEQKLCEIWQRLLKLERISATASFFKLGGHSLLVIRLLSEIRKHWQVEIPIKTMFEAPTLQSLAEKITQALKSDIPPISAVDRNQDLPLSFAQQRLWLIDQIAPGNHQYNLPMAFQLEGDLQIEALTNTFRAIIQRHHVLRTTFQTTESNEPIQVIHTDYEFSTPLIDLGEFNPELQEQTIIEYAHEEASHPFDLSNDLMIRAKLLRRNKLSHILFVTMHHIASDGWSQGILIKEFSTLYRDFINGGSFLNHANLLPALPIQYADYAHWQRQWLHGEVLNQHLQFWKEQLQGLPEVHNLPLDHPRPAVQSYQGATHFRVVNGTLPKALNTLALKHDATLFMVLNAAFAVLLSRYSNGVEGNTDEIVIGTPVANRDQSELEPLVGFFVNTLILRTNLSDNPSFEKLLQRSKTYLLAAYEHQQLPFEKLADELQPERSLSHSPLFQIMLSLQNNEEGQLDLPDLALKDVRQPNSIAQFDLNLDVFETDNQLILKWQYAIDLFDELTIKRLSGHFENLLNKIVKTPTQKVKNIPLLTESEQALFLNRGKLLNKNLPIKGIQELFESQVEKTPEAIAVCCESAPQHQLSYQELNRLANQLAHYLRGQGISAESIVEISMTRSLEMFIALLGVLKAGGAYLPIDPKLPEERKRQMQEASQVVLTLNNRSISLENWDFQNHPTENLPALNIPENLAYTIYTSGSTGTPKGSMITHHSLIHYCQAAIQRFGLQASDRVLQFAPLSFDVSVEEIFPTWLSGGTLVLINEENRLDLDYLTTFIEQQRITLMELPTAYWEQWAHQLAEQPNSQLSKSLRLVIIGGERVTSQSLKLWESLGIPLTHVYGLTETTVTSTTYSLNTYDNDTILSNLPIGKPLDDVQIYLLDSHLELVPVGVPGEVYIGGNFLARGYANAPELTAQRFIPHPFSNKAGERLYKTGDLAKWQPDANNQPGDIVFLNRVDLQVKIRGFRVELGEIQNTLLTHHEVNEAFIIAQEDPKRLVAYISTTCEQTDKVQKTELIESFRKHLKQYLPEYMIPSVFMVLNQLPLTANGKVDRYALPAPDIASQQPHQYVAPISETEKQLCEMWQTLLGIERVGTVDNFFELGGHSLLAVRLLAEIKKTFQRKITFRSLMEAPLVKELATHIEQADKIEAPLPDLIIDPSSQYQPFPLNDIQQAYWIGRSSSYELGNIGTHSYSETPFKNLDVDKFQKVLNYLIQRHSMLCMVITKGGEQQILETLPEYKVPFLDLECQEGDTPSLSIKEREAAILKQRAQMSHKVYSGHEWPLFEFRVTHFSKNKYIVHFSSDGLVVDDGSTRILNKEFEILYQSDEALWNSLLPPLTISFRDYVITEQYLRQTEVYQIAKHYWHARLPNFPMAPELPLRSDPSKIEKPNFIRHAGTLSPQKWNKLKAKAAEINITPTSLILTCFGLILKHWSKTPRFVLNLTLFNRLPFHKEVDRLVGDFTSLNLLEMDFSEEATFQSRLQQIQTQLWNDLEHRLYSGVEVQRELSRIHGNTVVMPVVLTSTIGEEQKPSTLEFLEDDAGFSITQSSQVWLDHKVAESQGELGYEWDSVEGIFPLGMLDSMFEAYQGLLAHLAEDSSMWDESVFHLTPPSHLQVRKDANATETFLLDQISPQNNLLHYNVFKTAKQQKEVIALRWGDDETMSYGELLEISTSLGHSLVASGAKPNTLIAILMEKGWEQIVASLGIMSSGAAYLPIEASLPHQRISQLLEIGQVDIVVTTSSVQNRLHQESYSFPEKIKEVIQLERGAYSKSFQPPPTIVQHENDIAYVIFTSGSTGTPKGVVIDHNSVLNTALDINNRFQVTKKDVVFALSAFNFDLSVYDVFGLLIAGGEIVIPKPNENRNPEAWSKYIQKYNITVWNTVPAYMQMLVETVIDAKELSHLRLILLSGDWIPMNLPSKIKAFAPSTTLISLGGATEASIWSIFHPIERVEEEKWGMRFSSIPYGKPLANQTFHVLQNDGTPTPEWVPGDLYIGGIGLARGYWKDEIKTNASFVISPHTGERLYKTGDLGRYLPNGDIEFLGRSDFQVKILGHRIELGEIEATLSEYPLVKENVVLALDTEANRKELVAYIVPEENTQSDNLTQLDGNDPHLLTDYQERLMFKLSLPGIRKFNDNTTFIELPDVIQETGLSYLPHSKIPSEVLPSEAAPSLADLSEVLSGLRAQMIENHPLPKYYYPSAGSLYPVQCYLAIPSGKGEPIPTGIYYYHPIDHKLIQVSSRIDPTFIIEAPFLIMLASEAEAILPIYGRDSHDFCILEAGYISTLLERTNFQTISIKSTDFPNVSNISKLFGLTESQTALALFEGRKVQKTISQPSLEDNSIIPFTHITRKSYREFQEASLSQDAFFRILAHLQDDTGLSQIGLYVVVKQGAIDGLQKGQYRWQNSKLIPLSESAIDLSTVFEGSEPILESAGFAILITQLPLKSISRDQCLYTVGALGQAISIQALSEEVGICAIGKINQTAGQALLHLSENETILHSFLGGKVSLEQINAFKIQALPTIDVEQRLEQHLKKSLPDYMIPNRFMLLPQIPLSSNGKVNRKALPRPDLSSPNLDYVAPTTAIEMKLCEIWQDVLGVKQIGINDNFFRAGGDSILSIKIVALAKQNGLHLTIQEIFTEPTIRALSASIENNPKNIVHSKDVAVFSLMTKQEKQNLQNLIDNQIIEDAYPLSTLQEGMIFHNKLTQHKGTYHDVTSFQLNEIWLEEAFSHALQVLMQHNELLRSLVHFEGNRPLHLIHKKLPLPLHVYDLRDLTAQEQKQTFTNWLETEKTTAFDWNKPLWSIVIHRLSDTSFQYSLACHHALLDGWSVAALNTELFNLYLQSLNKAPFSHHSPLPYRYFIAEELASVASSSTKDYWKNTLLGAELPWWSGRPKQKSIASNWTLDTEQSQRLQQLSTSLAVPEKSIFLTAHMILLNLLNGKPGITSSVVFNTRPERMGGEKTLGLFLTSLPFKLMRASGTWDTLIHSINKQLLEILDHRYYPLVNIQQESGLEFSGALFNYTNFHIYDELQDKLDLTEGQGFEETNYLFTLECSGNTQAANYQLSLIVDSEIFGYEFLDRIQGYLINILNEILKSPYDVIDHSRFIGKAERHQLLFEWNDTKAIYTKTPNHPIHSLPSQPFYKLFEQWAADTPHATAVICKSVRLTYGELNTKANQVAHYLVDQGIKPDTLVGLCVERSLEMLIGLLGILKAGGAYVPLDPSYPSERLNFMIEDSGIELLLTQQRLLPNLPSIDKNTTQQVCLDRFEIFSSYPTSNLDKTSLGLTMHHLAYVIYTSGSTGKPKGVLLEHRNVSNFLYAMALKPGLQDTNTLLAVTSISFDIHVLELYLPFVVGGQLVIATKDDALSGEALDTLIQQHQVDVVQATPATWKMLLQYGWTPKSYLKALCGGEHLPDTLKEQLVSFPLLELWNMYGPTETCVWSAVKHIFPEQPVVLGGPIANTTFYVLGSEGHLAPPLTYGELFIGGDGLARGYLNRPELTSEKFVPNPFSDKPNERLYRTGDMVRWLPNTEETSTALPLANLEFIGRIDDQVKIHGFRIELGEIEATLLEHDEVLEAVVIATASFNNESDDSEKTKRLIAYVVSPFFENKNDTQKTEFIESLQHHLKQSLPNYMIPMAFVAVDQLPLTPNGKIDRKALLKSDISAQLPNQFTAPQTDIEKQLCEIWQNLLHVKQVGVTNNFFELGGHSLLAVRLVSEIQSTLQLDISIHDIFEQQTVRRLAKKLEDGIAIQKLSFQDVDLDTLSEEELDRYLEMLPEEGEL